MSRDYSLELQQILSGVNHLKGLVSRAGAAVSTGPTVDFCCDMFDRPDQPVLDGYWDTAGSNWAIINHRLVPQGTATPSTIPLSEFIDSFQQSVALTQSVAVTEVDLIQGTLLSLAPASNTQTLYTGILSSRDINIRISFGIPGEPVPGAFVTSQSAKNRARSYVAGNYGICFGDAANRRLGVNGFFSKHGTGGMEPQSIDFKGIPNAVRSSPFGPFDVSTPDVTAVLPAVSYKNVESAAGMIFSDFSSFAHYAISPPVTTGLTQVFAAPFSSYGATPGYDVAGNPTIVYTATGAQGAYTITIPQVLPTPILTENTLLLQAIDNTYTIYLNGVQIYTETGAYMTRSRVGIAQSIQNMLSNLIAGGIPVTGISSFKAWPVGAAEPADQTGRGTYASGYNDKYHDAHGNYNPLA